MGDFGISATIQTPHLLVGRDPRRDERHQFLRGGAFVKDDERLRHLAGLVVWTGNDGDVGDRRVGEQDRLQLGRGDLMPLVLDQLLEPVDDGEVALRVGAADVARVIQPSASIAAAVASGWFKYPCIRTGVRTKSSPGCPGPSSAPVTISITLHSVPAVHGPTVPILAGS